MRRHRKSHYRDTNTSSHEAHGVAHIQYEPSGSCAASSGRGSEARLSRAENAVDLSGSYCSTRSPASAPKSPWRPAKCPQKNRKKKFKARPKCGLPPWFSCARSAAEFPRTMRGPFFFFSSPLASASRTVWAQKKARSGPSGRFVKGALEIRSPPLVFVRKVRGGVSAKDATRLFFFFFFFRILGGKSAPKSPWRPATCPEKNGKKKKKTRPKCGLPPWFSCARSAAKFPRTMRRFFFFFEF